MAVVIKRNVFIAFLYLTFDVYYNFNYYIMVHKNFVIANDVLPSKMCCYNVPFPLDIYFYKLKHDSQLKLCLSFI